LGTLDVFERLDHAHIEVPALDLDFDKVAQIAALGGGKPLAIVAEEVQDVAEDFWV
jgi:hypothetical protein